MPRITTGTQDERAVDQLGPLCLVLATSEVLVFAPGSGMGAVVP